MGTINSTLKKWQSVRQKLQDGSIAKETIDETKDRFLELNRQQLLEGKTSTGEDMPSYLDDPYFKSKESAQRYSDWKDKITPNPKRKKGASNLFIKGTFHESMFIDVKLDSVIVGATFKAYEIEAKNPNIYGLNSEKRVLYKEVTQPLFIQKIKGELNK